MVAAQRSADTSLVLSLMSGMDTRLMSAPSSCSCRSFSTGTSVDARTTTG